ncbi:tRNA guanosine(15) transglycosylase TgtA [Candidatus Bathyarchaeota archaeon]|nr:tRNA guanosine(15) transglycosylase TgtA [Candidatus Bathyarchaeota archaeon]
MTFEVKEKDLLARIGRLKTKSGTAETPLLFPVINPSIQPISPKRIKEEFGFEALITNAYVLKKRFQNQPANEGLHKFLDYDGVVMTDSGAYQILVYGDIEATSKEIVEYQERIGSDIATILDIPTGWKVSEDYAEQTVKETLKRAKEFFTIKTRDDILWVGPVQGGRYLNLVAKSAKEMGKLPFEIHALGSPTEVMERYRFDVLVDMIMTAKMNLPLGRPLHLFGAGHPFMFSLAIALGCDLFDSAAYTIYAKQNRYMTENGTYRLNELDYFPCVCPKCSKANPKQASELPQKERQIFLAEHNLYVCAAELKRIKQAIKDGRLWEHLEMRAHTHPALLSAVKILGKYKEYIEKHAPTVKSSGLFFFSSLGLVRSEVVHYRKNLAEHYTKPKETNTLLLMPQTQTKPFHKSHGYKQITKLLNNRLSKVHVCFYAAPFGVIPIELDEVYPLSQHETAMPLDKETIAYVANQIVDYINRTNYKKVIVLNDQENWNKTISNACKKACQQKNIKLKTVNNIKHLLPALEN